MYEYFVNECNDALRFVSPDISLLLFFFNYCVVKYYYLIVNCKGSGY